MTTDPDWFRDAVIYELHVRAFADSNGDGTGDFDGLTSKLDYLCDLGVTALWLLPFYPSPLRDDGYDIADYRVVNPAYGTMRSFRRFLTEAHARGLRVITELVINHTSDQHPWFQRARRASPGSRWHDFYVWSDTPDAYPDARVIFQDFETSNWTWDPVAGRYFWHRFYSHQPDLNFDNPAVEQALLDVLDFWLELGVDGLRLDAVPYLYEREGTNCENLPETHAFLRRLRRHVDDRFPGRMLLAEANQWPEDAAAYFGKGDECHMNFHFPLMPRMFMALQTENRMPIVDILEQTPTPPRGAQWATFLRNHDELTLEMVTDEERDLMLRAYARDSQMRINLGIRRRLAPLLGNDRRKIELLSSLLLSLPGTPVLYYGDEIGMGDNVYLGDRDGVRTPMQWTADRNAGFSSCNPHRLYLPLVTELGYHYESVNVETQLRSGSSLLSWMRQALALRRRTPALARGELHVLDPENPHVLAFVREMPGEPPVLCVANLSRLAQHCDLDLRQYVGSHPVEAFGRTRFSAIGEGPYSVTLAPFGFFWFVLEPAKGLLGDDHSAPRLTGSWDDVLRHRAALARTITSWMPRQRWFAAKDRTIQELVVDDVAQLDGVDEHAALLLVRVAFTEGDDQHYSVPVVRLQGQAATTAEVVTPAAVLATLDDGVLADAMAVPDGVRALARSACSKRMHRGRSVTVQGVPRRAGLSRPANRPTEVHLLGVDQSNSSAIVDGRFVAKLVRRLEPAMNPDVELPEHLTRHGFAHSPDVIATLEVGLAGETERATTLIVHECVANEGDLWSWTQHQLSKEIDERLELLDIPEDPGATTSALVGLLGGRLGELHCALAEHSHADDDDGRPFMPLPFTLLWQRSLLQSIRGGVRATQRVLRRNAAVLAALDGAVHPSVAPAALASRFVTTSPDELLARFEPLRARKLDTARIRVHGDLHLGQVLWTGRDVVFIDFEGEPARSIGERAIRKSPLVDVAGLVRSLDYAGRQAVLTAVQRGVATGADVERLERWRADWTERMSRLLIASYRSSIATTSLAPSDDDDFDLLLQLYVLDKALYEVRYEAANRPGWIGWPLAAVDSIASPAPVA